MTANWTSCFTWCALLLLLSWSRRAAAAPAPAPDQCAQDSALYRDLLLRITELLSNSTEFCYGIASDAVVIRSQDTLLACAPSLTQTPGCMRQSRTSFSKSECLRNIMKDLAYYDATIQSYIESQLRDPDREVPLLIPTQGIIKSLRENCSLNGETGENSKVEAAQLWGNDSFANRQEMCKIMKGLQTRTITINRAMGYMSSRDQSQ
ncbi:hypothetical protein Q5P01_010317 [Channa striata]|uniref:Interleukin-12 subunit alpha n=1 Tax=Channa striata TaxID=64152 RepID=A0AA88MXD9_CHASR|nr:hypothetical protein Q5P01_010317 [Channa striata]